MMQICDYKVLKVAIRRSPFIFYIKRKFRFLNYDSTPDQISSDQIVRADGYESNGGTRVACILLFNVTAAYAICMCVYTNAFS